MYEICINLGGIVNIGINGKKGYDIFLCNYVMNKLVVLFDLFLIFDMDGRIVG